MKVIGQNSHRWLIVSLTYGFRPHLDPGFVSKLFICSVLGLFLIVGSALAASIPISSTVSLNDPLLKQHGGAAANQVGDYVSSSGGFNGPYRYYIEVPAGTARLLVDIFDADVGMGGAAEANAGRDRTTSGNWTTTAYYRLFNPSGTQVSTNFTQGNATGPANSDNAWLTLYDSSADTTAALAPQFVAVQTNTGTSSTSLLINVPEAMWVICFSSKCPRMAIAQLTPRQAGLCLMEEYV